MTNDGKTLSTTPPPAAKATRDGFGEALLELGARDPQVVALTADLGESTRVESFAKKYPTRFFEVGVAEQNMVGIAAGLALSGKIPFAASYAAFAPGRTFDQFRVSVCYAGANVKLVSSHSGLAVGPDGATHQMLEDIAMMRALPGLLILQPADAREAKLATMAAARYHGPVYLRLSREPGPELTTGEFHIGRAQVLRKGVDVSLIGSGPILAEVQRAADTLLTRGISAEVINLSTVKPLDKETLVRSLQKTRCAVTVEDHQVMGGVGGAIAELCATELPTPLELVGVHGQFGESGKTHELWEKYHLTAPFIVAAAARVQARRPRGV